MSAMRQLPSGTVTLLSTDIEGSTRLGAPLGGWRRHRQENEERIRQLAGPEFDPSRVRGRELTLDEAVALTLRMRLSTN